MERKYQHTVNGQEVESSDINLIADDAALADDRVFAELFRMKPYDSVTNPNLSKAILPYSEGATVQPNGASGSVRIYPCRPMIAAKVNASVDAKDNWRGIRSTVYVGNLTGPYITQSLAANTSGVAWRWDTIYLRVDKDAAETSVTRYVK